MTIDAKDFRCMLAKDGNLDKVTFPLAVQDKLDGIRASVVDGRLVSRTLKLIPNAEIQEALGRPEFEGLDGELIVGEPTAPDCYRTTVSFVMAADKTGAPWSYHVFDKWDEDGGFTLRHARAHAVAGNLPFARMVTFRIAGSHDELEAIEAERIEEGHEGVIARVPDAPYKFGRSGKTGPLLKIKRFSDSEAKIVGVYEELHNANEAKRNALGRTERSSHKAGKVGKARLGGLILVGLPNDNEQAAKYEGVEFRCGTGFDAADRLELWTLDLTGRVARIKFFPIGAKDKPRHPVFLGWRNTEVDG
jgi:DNA ligase-1